MEPIVCSCLSVSEADVKRAIDEGAGSIAEVGQACEAGTGCTTCHEAIAFMLEKKARAELRHGRAPVQLRQLGIFGGERAPPPRSHVKPKPGGE